MTDSTSALFLTDPQAAIRLRQMQMAQALMQQGGKTDNIRSPWQVAGNMAQTLVGALQSRRIEQEALAEARESRANADRAAAMWQALITGGGGGMDAPAQQPPAMSAPASASPAAPVSAPVTQTNVRAGGYRVGGPAASLPDDRDSPNYDPVAASVARTQLVGQSLSNPARPGANSEMPGWDAGTPPPTGRINPTVGGPMGATPVSAAVPAPNAPAAAVPAQANGNDRYQRALALYAAQINSPDPRIREQAQRMAPILQGLRRDETRGQTVEINGPQGYGRYELLPGGGQRFIGGVAPPTVNVAPGGVVLDPITQRPIYQAPQAGYQAAPGGAQAPIPGGPQDPAVIARIQAAEREGQARGPTIAAAPQAMETADRTLAQIDGVLNHPGIRWGTGATSVLGQLPGTQAYAFNTRVRQLQGQAFLEAFNSLRGGGQITEVEGNKAQAAIARLDPNLPEGEFRQALQELRDIVETGRARAAATARQGTMPQAPPRQPNIPQAPQQRQQADPLEGRTAVNEQGQRIVRRNGQWVPAQ